MRARERQGFTQDHPGGEGRVGAGDRQWAVLVYLGGRALGFVAEAVRPSFLDATSGRR